MIPTLWQRGFLALAAIMLIAPAPSLFAWGDDGHEIIGVIAYARLAPPVKKKVDALLAADKDNLTATDFVSRTTWADKYRDSDRLTTRIRYNATRDWHFVDIEIADGDIDSPCNHHPKLPSGTVASAGPAKDCLIDKIDQFTAELRNASTTEAEKILALKFLLHRGGNEVPVLFNNHTKPENLHSYWDTEIVQRLGTNPRTVGTSLNNQINKTNADAWSKGTPTDWGKESFRQAKRIVYNFAGTQNFADVHAVKGVRLNAAYDNRALPVAREQLSKAGVRLATVLNNALK